MSPFADCKTEIRLGNFPKATQLANGSSVIQIQINESVPRASSIKLSLHSPPLRAETPPFLFHPSSPNPSPVAAVWSLSTCSAALADAHQRERHTALFPTRRMPCHALGLTCFLARIRARVCTQEELIAEQVYTSRPQSGSPLQTGASEEC